MDDFLSLYKERLNLQDTTFSRIDHEEAMVAVVYRVALPNGTQLILKISARSKDYLREVYCLTYLNAVLPVPQIIQVVPPEEKIHGAILMEYLPGSLAKVSRSTFHWLRNWEHCLQPFTSTELLVTAI